MGKRQQACPRSHNFAVGNTVVYLLDRTVGGKISYVVIPCYVTAVAAATITRVYLIAAPDRWYAVFLEHSTENTAYSVAYFVLWLANNEA